MTPCTRTFAKNLFPLLEEQNDELVMHLAHLAVESTIDMHTTMCSEDPKLPVFNNDDVRTRAHEYMTDILNDFSAAVLEKIKNMPFDAQINVARVITHNVKFD